MSGLPNKRKRCATWIIGIVGMILLTVCARNCWLPKETALSGSARPGRSVGVSAGKTLLEIIRRDAQSNSAAMEAEVVSLEPAESDEANPFLKTGIAEVYGRWLQLVQSGKAEPDEVLAGAALAELLRTDPDKSRVLPEIDRLISSPSVPESTKIALAGILGESASSEGLVRLIEMYHGSANCAGLHEAALEAIGDIASHRWDDTYREELTPALLEAWTQADTELRRQLGKAIAHAGSSAGVEFLFSTVLSAAGSLEELRTSPREDARIAVEAVREITNPSSIELLNRHLHQSREGELTYLLAGGVLANMGRVKATQMILDYAQTAPESAAPFVQGWLSQAKDPKSLRLIRERAETLPQPEMRQAARNAWETWYAQRSLRKPR